MPRLSSQAREKSFRTLSLLHIAASCAFVLNIFEQSSFVRLSAACTAQISELVLLAQAFQDFLWDNASAALGRRPMQRKDTTSFQQSDF